MENEQHGYSESERRIFSFTLNGVATHLDPLPPYWAILDDPAFEADMKLASIKAEMAQKEARAACRRLIAWARANFNLPPINPEDGSGATDSQAMDVLYGFLEFIGAVQKKTDD